VEKLNSRLLNLERQFITLRGMPGRPETRHVVLGTSATNQYGSVVMAGVRDALAECQKSPQDMEKHNELNLQFSRLQYAIEAAADSLKMWFTVHGYIRSYILANHLNGIFFFNHF